MDEILALTFRTIVCISSSLFVSLDGEEGNRRAEHTGSCRFIMMAEIAVWLLKSR
ncbi:hypothetical protein PO124_20945 [Bacillus licheniformis]|nr:hypothetical protein [Bacillus licheniformis]